MLSVLVNQIAATAVKAQIFIAKCAANSVLFVAYVRVNRGSGRGMNRVSRGT